MIAKLTFETSKKLFPVQATFTCAWLVLVSGGTVVESLPSFGVAAASVLGKVLPPSVERRMSTFARLTGAAVVPATFQVTAWVEPEVQATAVFGVVTAKKPAAASTVTVVVAELTPPLSLARILFGGRMEA